MESFDHVGSGFRDYLRQELNKRTRENPSYSLRAFAKHLGVSASGLSMTLSGKTPVTLNFIQRVSAKLKLKKEVLTQLQIQLINEKNKDTRECDELEFIDEDYFSIIKEWYHYAILNLMRTKGFRPQAAWVAKRLGITFPEAQQAIEKLQRINLLRIDNGQWKDLSSKFTTHSNYKKYSLAAKENQKTLFKMALESIENDTFDSRFHSGSTIAIKNSDIEQAKIFINKFRKEFIQRFDNIDNADEVYHISVGLFGLSRKEKK